MNITRQIKKIFNVPHQSLLEMSKPTHNGIRVKIAKDGNHKTTVKSDDENNWRRHLIQLHLISEV